MVHSSHSNDKGGLMRHHNAISCKSILVLVALGFLAGCAAVPAKPTDQTFKAPIVTLDSMEVAHYWGWWYYAKAVPPTKGTAGNNGAPLDLAFIFNIKNENTFPVMMESLKFTIAFEEFDLNTLISTDTQWIPPGKTNQIRVHAMFDGEQSRLSLMLVDAMKLQEKGTDAMTLIEKWWTGISQFAFPVYVKDGAAVFKADNIVKVSAFKAAFPK
jgi:hypothetical protein